MPPHSTLVKPTTPGSRRRTWALRLSGLAISLVALVVVFGTVDIFEAWVVLQDANPLILVAVLGIMVVQFLIRGWRWSVLLPHRPSGEPVPVSRTLVPMLVGYLGNIVLPARLGEPIRAFMVARRERLDALEAFGATMLERLVDTVTLALIGFAVAVVMDAPWWIVAVGAVAGFAGLAVLGLLVAFGFTRLIDTAVRILAHIGLAGRTHRLMHWARSFIAGVDRGRDVGRLLKVLVACTVAWALDALAFYLAARALGIELSYAGAILIGAVTVLSTAIPAAPGYVGTFELAATSVAVAIGVPAAEALALAVLVHVVAVVPIAIAGTVVVVASGIRLRQLADDAEELEADEHEDVGSTVPAAEPTD
jgi:uncharacterized protein (TIRG00374 family)